MEYNNFDQTHLHKVVELLNICFPYQSITTASFAWKHIDTYFEKKSVAMVAIEGDVICAFVCFTPTRIQSEKQVYGFYSCAVQATHPEYRRRGIISDLTLLIEKKLGHQADYLGFSNENGIRIDTYSKRIGYHILGRVKTKLVCALPYRTRFQIVRIEKLPPHVLSHQSKIGFLKDATYLRWRYESNPKNVFEYFEVRERDLVKGHIVCKKSRMLYTVYDLLMYDGEVEAWRMTIRSFAHFAFSQAKVAVAYSYLPNTFWHQSFPLISLSQNTSFYLTIKTDKVQLQHGDDWIVQRGDLL